jgi:Tol biopolymer transport system component
VIQVVVHQAVGKSEPLGRRIATRVSDIPLLLETPTLIMEFQMLHRLDILALALAISAAMSACARGPGVAASAENTAGSVSASRMSDLSAVPATRRLYSANEWVDEEIRPSPDGRYVSMTDWSTGNLVLRDLTTDSTVRLTHKNSWDESSDFSETSMISPDGKSIAYGWYSDSTSAYALKVMSLAGPDSGTTRVIYQGSRPDYTAAQAWTPDSRNVLAVIQEGDRTTHIAVVPVAGGKSKRLKSFDWRLPNNLSVSPDGNWLAYDFPPEEKSADRDVFLIALDGSGESVISRENGDDFVVGWTRDGSRLLYGSERGGTQGVWAVSVTNGKPTGLPILVRSDMWRMVPLGATKAGRVVYQVNTGIRDVFTAALDPKTGEVASKPTALKSPSNINPFTLAWSPDGQHMAQVVVRGHHSAAFGPSDITIRSIERGEIRRLSPQMSRINNVYWMPDGSGLVVRGADTKGQYGIFAVDLETAKMRTIARSPMPWFGRALALAPGSKIAYFVNLDSSSRKSQITRLDLKTGAMQMLYALDAPQFVNGMAASPDGRELAIGISGGVHGRGTISLLSTAGGIPREVYRFSGSEMVNGATGFSWSREGRDLIIGVAQSPRLEGTDLRALSLSDGTLRSLHIPTGRISVARMSPDGRHIAYAVNDISAELWTMDEPVFDSKAVADRH